MDDILSKFNLSVKKVRGKDEFEMYKNYINDLPYERIPFCLYLIFEMGNLKQKNNSKAIFIRLQGNNAFKFEDYQESIRLYTKSLRYANYNSEEYAVALANRSAVQFAMENYTSSIDDINLCLEANYPNHLRPKAYIRKAKCFQKLGEATDMRKTLIDLLSYFDSSSSKALLKSTIEKYKMMVKDLITAPAEKKSDPEDKFDIVPILKANPTFLNASSSVMLKYKKQRGCHVVARKEIVPGDVLFVEKAYTFAPLPHGETPKEHYPIHCQYCLIKITSSIPCKRCVKHLYCNEKCRDTAWMEFHRWESIGIQRGFFNISKCGYLALRIILKAVCTGISTDTINFEGGIISYGNKDNNYPYIYNLPSNFHKMEKNKLMEYVAVAALIVNYLKVKTNFFEWMKQLPNYCNKGYKELMNKLGGLILRHCTQLHPRNVPVTVFDSDSIPNMITIANTVCPSVAMMNHSCIPNTATYFVGNTVVVKATKNIKVNEDVCYSMIGANFITLNKDVRLQLLRERYYMNCSCQMCSDPRMDTHDSYLCIKCKGPAPPLTTDDSFAFKQCACLDCNYKFTLPADVTVRERLAFQFLIRFHRFEDINDANRCLEISKTIFRPNHSIFEELYNKLLNYYKDKGEAGCFIKIGKIMIDHFESKYDEFAVVVGLCLYMICVCAITILQETAVTTNFEHLGKILEDLTNFVEKAKMVFNLQYPQFNTRLQKLDKSIFELRVLHTLQITNKRVHGRF